MLSPGQLLVKIRRSENPFYAFLFRMAKGFLYSQLPVPGLMRPFFRGLYHMHFGIRTVFMRAKAYFYWEPAFRCRCDQVGKNLVVTLMPDIDSNVQLLFGENVRLNGALSVMSGKWFKNPRLVVGNNVHIGHRVSFTVNKEIVIEDGVMIASRCYFADTDAHPTDPTRRVAGEPPAEDKVKPVRLGRNSWIGHGCHVLKGVTIGEASIVAAGSVVTTDVPPFSIVAGNPARVVSTKDRSGNEVSPDPGQSSTA